VKINLAAKGCQVFSIGGGAKLSFMNRGMQNRRQKRIVSVIVVIVIMSFLISIVSYAFY
jgi:hypothetical protein